VLAGGARGPGRPPGRAGAAPARAAGAGRPGRVRRRDGRRRAHGRAAAGAPGYRVAPAGPPPLRAADPALADRAVELLGLPEIAGWFLDPESVQSDALEVQEARESRLVVSDQIKAERQEAILARVIEREFTPEARRRWGRRFAEMAWVFEATDRGEHAALAAAAAAMFDDSEASLTRHPLPRALAQRALELASEVAAGRLRAADVSRKP